MENLRDNLSEKEYAILLASLVYSADKIANTCGHYDAYIQGETLKDAFHFDFIKPYDLHDKQIEIYREDANILAKKIECDIAYIDPPYNRRQYNETPANSEMIQNIFLHAMAKFQTSTHFRKNANQNITLLLLLNVLNKLKADESENQA